MVAVTIAAFAFAAPVMITGTHPIILDFQSAQLLVEPREKGFFILGIMLAGLFGLVGSVMQQHFIIINKFLLCCLILDIVFINSLANLALNTPEGVYWGLSGIVLSIAVAFGAASGGKFKSVSRA